MRVRARPQPWEPQGTCPPCPPEASFSLGCHPRDWGYSRLRVGPPLPSRKMGFPRGQGPASISGHPSDTSRGPAIDAGGLTMFSQLPTSSWTPGIPGQHRILLPVRDSGHKSSRGSLLPQDPPGRALTGDTQPRFGPRDHPVSLCGLHAEARGGVSGSGGGRDSGRLSDLPHTQLHDNCNSGP